MNSKGFDSSKACVSFGKEVQSIKGYLSLNEDNFSLFNSW